jgi:hypothetical protein
MELEREEDRKGGREGGEERKRECIRKSIYKAEVSYSAIMYVTYELVATGRKVSNIYEEKQQMAALNVT